LIECPSKRSVYVSRVALALGVGALAVSAIKLTPHGERIVTIWLANGLWLGVLMTAAKSEIRGLFIAACLGNLGADLASGDRLPVAALLTTCDALEVCLSLWSMRADPGTPRLSTRSAFIRFFLVCTLGSPLLAGLVASAGLHVLTGAVAGPNFLHWLLAHALGVSIVTPIVVMAEAGSVGKLLAVPTRWLTLRSLTLFTAVSAGVFYQQRYPLLFLIPPALAYVAAELGFAATAFLMPLLAVAALGGTIAGHGPLVLNAKLGPDERLILVQLFLLSAVVLSARVAYSFESRRTALADLGEANDRLRLLAATDTLTGLANRREFDRVLDSELHRVDRGSQPLSLLLIDIDHFKRVNDTLGHTAGDDRICEVATHIKSWTRRPNDVAARFGGEEFALILPGADVEAAAAIAQALRFEIAQGAALRPTELPGGRTVSIGVATTGFPGWTPTRAQLVAVADGCLYGAKLAGRNCVRGTTANPPVSDTEPGADHADALETEVVSVAPGVA
jgi:diguanylate cyclase (GGDEF)-like protein